MNNFFLAEEKELPEINSVGYLYKHISGAELIFIKNDDANKVFSVAFKTFPEDDKGTAHVLEHCILCGSKKFPLKDVFAEISSSCLYTYLNAITFQDKTVYPVASLYEPELIKLIDIYLDCMFKPLLRLETFLNEAWHYENLGDNVNANGIVYSEMKSSFSNPVREMRYFLYKELFCNVSYKFESAGCPKEILKLKHEDIILFYKKYYCAKNCFLYLYGDVKDINLYLNLFDGYLKKSDSAKKNFVDEQVSLMSPVLKHRAYDYCGANKKYFGSGFVIGNVLNYELEMAFEILNSYLTKTVGAPLRKFLPFAKTIFDSEIYQPVYLVLSENFNGSLEKFKDMLMQIFLKINNMRLEKILLESCLNNLEFKIRTEFNKNRPKGLLINFLILKSWIYGGNVFERINRLEVVNNLRKKIDSNYFGELINKYILNNNHAAFVCLMPDSKNKFSFEISQQDIKNAMLMKKFINKEEENRNLIELANLNLVEEKNLYYEIKQGEDENIFYFESETQEIIYLNFVFKANGVDKKDLSYLGLLCEILIFVTMEKKQNKNMQEILNNLGNIKLNFGTYECEGKKFMPMLSLKIKLMKNKIDDVIEIVQEIFSIKDFDEDSLIKKLIEHKLMIMKNNFINKPRQFVIKKVFSYVLDEFRCHDFIDGFEFYDFIKKIINDFDDEDKKNDLKDKILDVYKIIFKRENLAVNIVCENKNFNMVYSKIKKLLKIFDTREKINVFGKIFLKQENKSCEYKFDLYKKNQAFFDLAKVNTNGLVIFLNDFEINGASKVFESLMDKIYLMREIRINGGAYDSGCKFKNNAVCFYSYADNNIGLSYKKFLAAADFVLNFDFDSDKNNYLKKAIISAINIFDKPKGIFDRANLYFIKFLAKKDFNTETKKMRREILDTNANDLKNIAKIIKANLKTKKICVLGNREKIYSERELFDEIKKL